MSIFKKLLSRRTTIQSLREENEQLQFAVRLSEKTIASLEEEVRKLKQKHDQQSKGVGVLFEFIRRTHRLTDPVIPGTIRELINQK